jgi:hypothetical protein
MVRLRDRAWSPYLSGVILGLLVVPALWVADVVPDPSAGLVMVGRHLGAALDSGLSGADTVPGHPSGSRGWWQVALLVGIFLGALLSATLSGSRRDAPSPVWAAVLGTDRRWVKALATFFGGFVMMAGATLASGDLFGHGLFGVAQLAISSVVTAVAIGLGGLAMGRLLRRP